MSLFFNKRESEMELIETRNNWINKFIALSVGISETPLELELLVPFKDAISKDVEENLCMLENMFGGNNPRRKIAMYSSMENTIAYYSTWSKALASTMYYVYGLDKEFIDAKSTKEKISQMLVSQFFNKNGFLADTKKTFFDYKEYVIQYLKFES